jgi:hypothetical protein
MKKTCLSIIISSIFCLVAHAQVQKSNTPSTLLTPMDQQLKLDPNINNIVTGVPVDQNKVFEKALTARIRKASINANQTAQQETFYSTMPVAGNKNSRQYDNMPLAKLGDTSTRYTMLVKRIDIIDPIKKEQQEVNP